MADTGDNLGDLTVNVTGDFSELQDAIDQSVSVAQSGSEAIASALQGVSDASGLVGRDLEIFQQLLQADADAGVALQQSLEDLSNSAGTLGDQIASGAAAALEQLQAGEQSAGDAAEATTGSLNDEAGAISNVSENAEEAETGLSAMAEGFFAIGEALALTEGLKEFIQESIDVYGETQNVITSLELLGSTAAEAEETISSLSDMSLNLAVPFEDLEQAARRLTVAFQGVEGIDINDVLQTAADSAALTGKSFDQVTTALQRVEVTGAVTSRQLLQLGITWQQLAATAGTSVAEVQAVLKKGGQDATQDLELVMQTINAMASGAAQAQAQTILGQITILENQVKLMFDSIGQAITPVMAAVVAAVSEGVQVARDFLTAFQELPAPIQNVAVVVAGATAAVVPLALAAGALGIALNGITLIGPAFTSLMTAMGISATEDAAAETAAAIATEAHGAAAVTTAGELETLAGAEGAAATEGETAAVALGAGGVAGALAMIGVVALSAGTAMAVTVDNVNQLKDQWTEAMTSIRSQNILEAIQSGASLQALEDIGNSVNQIKAAFGGLGSSAPTVMEAIATSAETPIQTLMDMGYTAQQIQTALKGIGTTAVSAWQAMDSGATIEQMGEVGMKVDAITAALNKMGPAAKNNFGIIASAMSDASGDLDIFKSGITVLGSGMQTLGPEAQAVANNVVKLKQAVTDATTAVNQTKAALDGSETSADNYNAAQVKLTAAQKSLNSALGETPAAVKPAQDSIEALAQADADAQTKFDAANTSWANLMTAFNNGQSTILGLSVNANQANIAWNNLAAAYQKATGAVLQWNAAAGNTAGIVLNETNQLTTLQNAVDMTGAALKSLQDSYNAALAAGTATAQQLQTLQIAYNDNQKAITALAKATDTSKVSMDELTGASTDYAQVVVNGTTVQAGYTQAQLDAARASDEATNAIGGEGTAVQDLLNKYAQAQAAATGYTSGVRVLGQTQTDAATTAANLAAQTVKTNQAWADGKIVLQNYAGVLVQETTAATDAGNAAGSLGDEVKQMASDMVSAGEQTNEEADALLALASAADDAADAVTNLNNANSKVKGGGAGGGGSSLATILADEIAVGQDPALGGAIGGGGLNQGQIDQMAQALANATGEAVTTLDGYFVPAVAASTTATTTNTTATTANTTATTTNTVATTASTTATITQTQAQTNLAAAVTQYQTDLASGSATAQQLTTDLANVGSAEQALTTATADTTAATVASTDSTSQLTQLQAAFATAAQNNIDAQNALQSAITAGTASAGEFGSTLNDAASATAQAADQAQAALDSFAASLNNITESSAGPLSDAVQATVQPLTAVQQALNQLNSDIQSFSDNGMIALDAFTNAQVAQIRSDEATLQSAQLAQEGVAGMTQAAQNAVAPLTGVQQALQQLQNDLVSFGAVLPGSNLNNPSANLTATQLSTIASDQAAVQKAELAQGGGAGISGTPSWQYVNPNPDLMASPTGNAYGAYSGSGGGVNLTVNVTGNSVTSAALVDQLANKVSSVIVTNLRTNAGLKN